MELTVKPVLKLTAEEITGLEDSYYIIKDLIDKNIIYHDEKQYNSILNFLSFIANDNWKDEDWTPDGGMEDLRVIREE